MDAKDAQFIAFLEGSKQYIIPTYQRTYSWQREQCDQLWNDIIHATTLPVGSTHFVGSVVYVQDGIFPATGISKLLVIDGQQRMTTVTLLLIALIQLIKQEKISSGTVNVDAITDNYLTNRHSQGDDHYKLLLTRSDRETLKALIDGRELHDSKSERIDANYRYFLDKIQQGTYSAEQIFEGIGRLAIVYIALERPKDNPQLIFESMNSTGIDLSETDLIRNYVLMGLEPEQQEKLYHNVWYPMERLFGSGHPIDSFDRFMRDYLTMKSPSGKIPNIKLIYRTFKAFRQNMQQPIEVLLDELYRHARAYSKIAFAEEENPHIHAALHSLRELEANVTYPMLLEVFIDYEDHLLDQNDLIAIIRLVESYVFRRAICDMPTNSMNKTFAGVMRLVDKVNYRQSVEAAFYSMTSYKRMPKDDEFQTAFHLRDIYHSQRCNYLLRRLENYQRREPIAVGNYTIEHIMPQNEHLSLGWQIDLGPDWQQIQQTYLHTLGNLTLTGYNPELGDRDFQVKRDMEGGFRHNPLFLNSGLGQLEHWNKETIQTRGKQLAERAALVWYYPQVDPGLMANTSNRKTNRVYTLADHAAFLQGAMLELFTQLQQQILNLDPDVQEEIRKQYIAYKFDTNFVDLEIQQKRIKAYLNMPFAMIEDPLGKCTDISTVGHHANGDIAFSISVGDDLAYPFRLIQQSLRYQQSGNESAMPESSFAENQADDENE